ncbi:nitrite reductase, copper-containing [Candidatus Kaiserbacteria bacterium RIFCSPHIGHO2_01_FULL_46_22]|uniref:Copper-containing nitrite reductase n=1 Tax=Candidatus Kaiserbacteria bacterium RIFCSPHIGHO2_01_FULL_46_22 TaxID=1798475 RepID=A0A1F6BX28_9BACT|nr:MAG: nitrite reductase, copper-containing [Candidatus Kaiserbacteria bacterium RIFCSPHIGHO2_01_FULL_46_22]
MQTTLSLFSYLLTQGFGFIILAIALTLLIVWSINDLYSKKTLLLFVLIVLGWVFVSVLPLGNISLKGYPFSLTTYGPGEGPILPLSNMLSFFRHANQLPRVEDIARDPRDVPPPLNRNEPAVVDLKLTALEVVAEMAPGVVFNYWTFDGQVPGPMLRVRVGDTVRLTLTNDATNLHHHNIDLHAVTGPGGGAVVTDVDPGESKVLTFKAMNPGLFVYHCAYPNMANHMAHGMYGLILVEPEEGLPPVDKEFYVMQGEFYSKGGLGKRGLQVFDAVAMLESRPTYVVFNGRVGGINDKITAETGETVRTFVGNGGVNLISSFHLVGEIFDRVYGEGAVGSEPHQNVQTTLVPAGGSTIVEFGLDIPGRYTFVDHALSRVDRGAWGTISVNGMASSTIFDGDFSNSSKHGH